MPPKYKVLVLGAGFVTRPLVHYLSQHNIHVILVDIILSNAQNLIKGATNAEARKADITNEDDLKKIDAWTSDVDAVVSMLPYVYHPSCAKIAIKHKKPFFTTSYVSDAMRELEEDAKKASVILLNECGLDPGSDHMSAMRMIEHIRRNGGNIVSFTSFCGGLPAPHCNNNPLGYKFSWAPRGVLLACKNDARFLRDGKEVFIPAKELFERFEIDSIEGLGEFEVYPNRNSLQYLHIYNIPEAKTLIRGTYRYKGWCPTIKKLADLGYLETNTWHLGGLSYKELTKRLISKPDTNDLKADVAAFLKLPIDHFVIHNMEWLGLFGDEEIPANITTTLDALCEAMLKRMKYEPGEVDMVVMRHTLVAEYPKYTKREYMSSTLVVVGEPNGDTAMARTVSLPVAIAIRLVLEGRVTLSPGLIIPTIPELYNPILDEESQLGIKFEEKVDRVEPM